MDRLVRSGQFRNRSEVIKEATRLLVSSGDLAPRLATARMASRLASLTITWNTPDVESIVLYGSTARGHATSESDIDLLVVIREGEPWKVRRKLYELIYPIIATLNLDISLLVVTRLGWSEMVRKKDPITASIVEGGMPLWGQARSPGIAEKLIAKAMVKPEAARELHVKGFYEDSASHAYYAMFHAARAALTRIDVTTRTHKATVSEFGRRLVVAGVFQQELGRSLAEAKAARDTYEYSATAEIGREEADALLKDAEKFVVTVKTQLKSLKPEAQATSRLKTHRRPE